jgi:hypothetical protein
MIAPKVIDNAAGREIYVILRPAATKEGGARPGYLMAE